MQSVVRSVAVAGPALIGDRRPSAWTRTVAVIRIPRFNVLDAIRWKETLPEDPLAAFATETELDSRGRRRSV